MKNEILCIIRVMTLPFVRLHDLRGRDAAPPASADGAERHPYLRTPELDGSIRALSGALIASLAAALFAGCGSPSDSAAPVDGDGHAQHDEAVPAVVFKSGRGIQLGATAAQFIGLATAEVAARDLPDAAAVPAIPETALLRTVRGEFVFVANGGWYLRTPVRTGATAGGWVEIRDGLYEGDTVVANGARALWLAEIQAVNGGVSCTHGH